MSEDLRIAAAQANIDSLAETLPDVGRIENRAPEPSEGELILLHEGLDLLAAFKKIPDRKTRQLVITLVDAISGKDAAKTHQINHVTTTAGR